MIAPFVLAIVGRPNVGKSTLFNRLVGRKLALVDDQPGVTRDRRFGDARLGDLRFQIVDTAGFEEGKSGSLEARMRAQTEAAIGEADMVLMLTDARVGLLPEDELFARLLRKANVPVILAGNKSESKASETGLNEMYSLGLGEPIALSAEHGHGTDDLYTQVRDAMDAHAEAHKGDFTDIEEEDEDADFDPDMPFEDDPDKPLRVAILGRPNAGKSTLINYILGQDRLLTGPEAGITRDSISVNWTWESVHAPNGARPITLWDTAGVRRKSRVTEKLEKLSVADGLRAVKFAEVVVLLVDATTPFDKQDIQLADLIEREGRALVVGINKWDLKLDRKEVRQTISDALLRTMPRLRGVPVIMMSAHTGKGVEQLMPAVQKQYEIWNARIGTAKLNKWLGDVIDRHPPPADKGRPVRLRYITQAKARPPTFVTFSSRGHAVPESYQRYLANSLRETFSLDGVPLRIFVRKGKNPYEDR
ncbi:MAG: ribosome biogenesis GTPase Der [Rhodobiaceae bacterium]|jgi:GTP-binding protein|nr:ribosome biogenesis GTPase Der [Rhodobiaceae bacterium]